MTIYLELQEFKRALFTRTALALYQSLCDHDSFEANQVELLNSANPRVITMLTEIFRAVYVVAPSGVNLYRYLADPATIVPVLTQFSAKLERKEMPAQELPTYFDLGTIKQFFDRYKPVHPSPEISNGNAD